MWSSGDPWTNEYKAMSSRKQNKMDLRGKLV